MKFIVKIELRRMVNYRLLNSKIYLIIFYFLIIGNSPLYSQNIVPNDDFEQYSSCPSNSGEIFKLLNWFDPTNATSDYYNMCGTGGANVPYCGNGFQFTYSGDGMAGLWALNGIGNNYREYVSVELSSIMQVNRCYKIEFFANLHNYSGFGIQQIGLIVTDSLFSTPNFQNVLEYTPSIEAKNILSDTISWVKVSGYYTSLGGEKFITIGNFRRDTQTDTVSITGNSYPGAYYLIDKVLVEEIPGCDTLGINVVEEMLEFSVFPNPNNGSFNISNQSYIDTEFILFDVIGNKIFSVNITKESSQNVQLNNIENGIYLFKILSNNECVKTGKLIINN